MDKISFFIFFLLLLKFSNSQIQELDFYAYYVPIKNLIICSEKEYMNSNLIMNEFESEEGYTCLINLKKAGVYRITLHVSMVEDKTGIFSDSMHDNINQSKSILEINIGTNSLFHNLDLNSFSVKSSFAKQFWAKFESGKVSFLPNDNCDPFSQNCDFIFVQESVFMKKFIKLNFNFIAPDKHEIILLEEKNQTAVTSGDCDPDCVYGVCNGWDCVCQFGYMGTNCSIKLVPKEFRIGVIPAGLLVLGCLIAGFLVMYLFWLCTNKLFASNDIKDSSKEVDVMEHWGYATNTNG